ncbi:MAG: SoxR reducing system RseC family protein [Rhodocyclaceae bacterium]|nr:SoxR reducing system RseC family protein [Rhodocyclaceae bacterium]
MSHTSEATVIAIQDGHVVLRLTKPLTGCGRCEEAGGCGSGLAGRNCRTYRLPNTQDMAVGDRVNVSVADGTVLVASLFSYFLPAVLAIIGAAAGAAVGGDGRAVAGCLGGLAAGFLLLRVHGTGRTGSPVLHVQKAGAASAGLHDTGNRS